MYYIYTVRTTCSTYGYNKLVLAQHLDDLCESFFMSVLHNGQTRTMKAKYRNDAGDLEIIRPFIYLRESSTRDFSLVHHLPIINENCPACFEQPKERARVKKVLQQEETMVPNLFYNLKRAMVPLMHDETYSFLQRLTDEITAKSNTHLTPKPISSKRQFVEMKESSILTPEDTAIGNSIDSTTTTANHHMNHGTTGTIDIDESMTMHMVKKAREDREQKQDEYIAIEMTMKEG
jgi:hypothetical protein